jgi:hypothetical protein
MATQSILHCGGRMAPKLHKNYSLGIHKYCEKYSVKYM